MNIISKLSLFTVFLSNHAFANGFYAFNQSSNAFGLAGAYQTQAKSADASYYNPANLVWIKNPHALIEFDGTIAYQEKQNFNGKINLPPNQIDATGAQEPIESFIPYLFYVSQLHNNWRWGISTTYQGASSRWKNQPQALLVGQATSASILINPVLSYRINDKWSIGAGIELSHSMLEQKTNGNLFGPEVKLDLDTNGTALGENIALNYKATHNINFSAHYRTSIKTKLTGKAKIIDGIDNYDGKATLTILKPASLKLSGAYQIDNTWLELAYSRIYWSELKTSQLQLQRQLTGIGSLFQTEAIKNWRDTDTLHIGISHPLNNQTNLLFGISQDLNTAVPKKTINFDWLDSKITNLGIGFTYQFKPNLSIGAAYNYAHYEKVNVKNTFLEGNYDRNVHVICFSLSTDF